MNKEKQIYQQVLLLFLQLHWLINKRLFADIFEFFIQYLPVNKAQIRGELADLVEVIYTVKGKT
ncbi:MAG: hypothetical protein HUJ68_13435, partial [Clostridia bacterium]|nr:hypothetical protein [Clostridia bacterium]